MPQLGGCKELRGRATLFGFGKLSEMLEDLVGMVQGLRSAQTREETLEAEIAELRAENAKLQEQLAADHQHEVDRLADSFVRWLEAHGGTDQYMLQLFLAQIKQFQVRTRVPRIENVAGPALGMLVSWVRVLNLVQPDLRDRAADLISRAGLDHVALSALFVKVEGGQRFFDDAGLARELEKRVAATAEGYRRAHHALEEAPIAEQDILPAEADASDIQPRPQYTELTEEVRRLHDRFISQAGAPAVTDEQSGQHQARVALEATGVPAYAAVSGAEELWGPDIPGPLSGRLSSDDLFGNTQEPLPHS